jgi:DNA-binding MarR family transcriptional regulator
MDEKELRIISEISKNGNLSQRDLARRVTLSLGMVNIILSKLIKRGVVGIKNMNRKKVYYFLTPKGLAMKSRQTYRYVMRTIGQIKYFVGEERLKELASLKEGIS